MKQSFSTSLNLFKNTFKTFGLVWGANPSLVVLLLTLTVLIAFVPFGISGSRAILIDELISASKNGLFTNKLLWAVVFLLASSFIPSVLYTFQRYVGKIFWYVTQTKFEMSAIAKRAELDIATYEDPAQNNLLTRVRENGVWRLQNFIDRQFYLIQDLVQFVVAGIILGSFAWWVILVMLIGVLPELLIELKYGRDTWSLYDEDAEVRRRYWDLHDHFSGLASIVEMRLFQNIPFFTKKIYKLYTDFQNKQRKLEKRRLYLKLLSMLVLQGAGMVVVVWSVFEVLRGNIQIGLFTFFLASLGDFRESISSLFSNVARQYEDSLFVTDIFTFLSLPKVLKAPARPLSLPRSQVPDIVFDNVSFVYPGTQKLVLKNINLSIPAGHKVALVGVNGSGKTTLVKLLCRFYDPTEGRILVGGKDLRELNLDSWYRQMGILFQEYSKYHFPVSESIALGDTKLKYSLQKVKDAAVLGEANKFIENWPGGYGQMLGREFTNGIEPSIGQWQKLALARVFYRDPHVLVLDEPTASIDAEAEAKIFERLEKVAVGKTLIMISHRFSTVRKAHQIVVISNGEIVEQGSHEDLMMHDRVYAQLFRLQAKGYE